MKKHLALQLEVLCALAVLLCTAVLAVCSYGTAHRLAARARDTSEATALCQTAAELFASTGGGQAFADALQQQGWAVQHSGNTFVCTISATGSHTHTLHIETQPQAADAGTLVNARFVFTCGQTPLCRLETAKYIPAQGGRTP